LPRSFSLILLGQGRALPILSYCGIFFCDCKCKNVSPLFKVFHSNFRIEYQFPAVEALRFVIRYFVTTEKRVSSDNP